MATPQHGARKEGEKEKEIESQKIKRNVVEEHFCIIDNSERINRVLLLVFTFPLPLSVSVFLSEGLWFVIGMWRVVVLWTAGWLTVVSV